MRLPVFLDNNIISTVPVISALVDSKSPLYIVYGSAQRDNLMAHSGTAPFEKFLRVSDLSTGLEKGVQ